MEAKGKSGEFCLKASRKRSKKWLSVIFWEKAISGKMWYAEGLDCQNSLVFVVFYWSGREWCWRGSVEPGWKGPCTFCCRSFFFCSSDWSLSQELGMFRLDEVLPWRTDSGRNQAKERFKLKWQELDDWEIGFKGSACHALLQELVIILLKFERHTLQRFGRI